MYNTYTCTASYIKDTLVYFITWEIQYIHSVFLTWYQSHCFVFFLAVLSLFGVTSDSLLLPLSQLLLLLFAVKPLMHLNICLWFRTCNHHRWGVSRLEDHYQKSLPPWILLRLHFCKYQYDWVLPIYWTMEILLSLEPSHASTCLQKILHRDHMSTRHMHLHLILIDIIRNIISATSILVDFIF